MPEQLVAPPAAATEHGDHEPEAEPREAVDMTVLRALRESRRDVEALDLTAERLRRLQVAFTKAADASRARTDRYAEQNDADGTHPVREDDQRAHRPQEPGTAPRPGDRPLSASDAAHPMLRCAPTMRGVHTRVACPAKGPRGVWIGF